MGPGPASCQDQGPRQRTRCVLSEARCAQTLLGCVVTSEAYSPGHARDYMRNGTKPETCASAGEDRGGSHRSAELLEERGHISARHRPHRRDLHEATLGEVTALTADRVAQRVAAADEMLRCFP